MLEQVTKDGVGSRSRSCHGRVGIIEGGASSGYWSVLRFLWRFMAGKLVCQATTSSFRINGAVLHQEAAADEQGNDMAS